MLLSTRYKKVLFDFFSIGPDLVLFDSGITIFSIIIPRIWSIIFDLILFYDAIERKSSNKIVL